MPCTCDDGRIALIASDGVIECFERTTTLIGMGTSNLSRLVGI